MLPQLSIRSYHEFKDRIMYIIKGLVKLAGSIMTQGEKFKWVLISLNLTERVTPLKIRQQSNSENAIYKQ